MIEDYRLMYTLSIAGCAIPSADPWGSVRDIPKKILWDHMPAVLCYVLLRFKKLLDYKILT